MTHQVYWTVIPVYIIVNNQLFHNLSVNLIFYVILNLSYQMIIVFCELLPVLVSKFFYTFFNGLQKILSILEA